MTTKSIFSNPDICASVCKNIVAVLNNQNDFSNPRIANSPRAVGDTVQSILETEFEKCMSTVLIKNYVGRFPRKSMADISFYDKYENLCYVDIKTHNVNTSFSRPNITAVKRLSKFYKKDNNYFALLLVEYENSNGIARFTNCIFCPIEHIDWSCLTFGALGWGQIQIADSNRIVTNSDITRKQWMLEFYERLSIFYPKEIEKIKEEKIKFFQNERKFWEKHE